MIAALVTKPNHRRLLFCLCLLALIEAAPAATNTYGRYSTLVTLHIRHYDAAANYGHNAADITMSNAGVSILDRYHPHVVGGVEIGIALSDPTPRPSLAGLDLHGHYLGLELTGHSTTQRVLQMFASFKYRYTDVEDETDNQRATLRWHRVDGIGGIIIRPAGNVETRLYASWTILDGKHVASGRIDESIDVRARKNAGMNASIQWEIEPDGYVGATLYTGALTGGKLFFSRNY